MKHLDELLGPAVGLQLEIEVGAQVIERSCLCGIRSVHPEVVDVRLDGQLDELGDEQLLTLVLHTPVVRHRAGTGQRHRMPALGRTLEQHLRRGHEPGVGQIAAHIDNHLMRIEVAGLQKQLHAVALLEDDAAVGPLGQHHLLECARVQHVMHLRKSLTVTRPVARLMPLQLIRLRLSGDLGFQDHGRLEKHQWTIGACLERRHHKARGTVELAQTAKPQHGADEFIIDVIVG